MPAINGKRFESFLVINDIEPPRTHDLLELIEICKNISSDFSAFGKKCMFVTKYGIIPKYPNELQINDDDVRSAIRYAKEIKEFVIKKTEISQ